LKTAIEMSNKPVICFDTSKNERFQISDNYKMLHRKLKVNWIVEQLVYQQISKILFLPVLFAYRAEKLYFNLRTRIE